MQGCLGWLGLVTGAAREWEGGSRAHRLERPSLASHTPPYSPTFTAPTSSFGMSSQTVLARPHVIQTSKRPPPSAGPSSHLARPTVVLSQPSPLPPSTSQHNTLQTQQQTSAPPQTTGGPSGSKRSVGGRCAHLSYVLDGERASSAGADGQAADLVTRYTDVVRWGMKLRGVGQPRASAVRVHIS